MILPIGLVVFAVVAGVWEFATSGLEMGLTFLWIGLGFWLLVRTEERRDSAVWCALVVGLGTLIRPELILMSMVELAALGVVVSASGWRGPTSITRRYLAPLVAAVALPSLYEVWRMAYFALIVPNTALAKSAGASWWSQGFTYVWNFIAPYTLWLPFALAIPIVRPRLVRWWRNGDRTGVIVLLTPVAMATVDILYVARIGGDYQHARLLLPGFLSLCLPVFVSVRQLRTLLVIPVVGIIAWSVACAGWLRFSTGGVLRSDHGIIDERAVWIDGQPRAPTRSTRPTTTTSSGASTGRLAAQARGEGRQVMLVEHRADGAASCQAPPTSNRPDHHCPSPGGQCRCHRGDRLPEWTRRLHLRRLLAGQPHRFPLRRHPPQPARAREVHRRRLDDRSIRDRCDRAARRRVAGVGHRRPARSGLRPSQLLSACHHRAAGHLAGRSPTSPTHSPSPP